MSDLSPRPRSRTSRREREQRAYVLTLATGGLAVIAVVGLLLAIFGVVGLGLPVLAGLLAVVCGVVLRRMFGS